MICTFFARGGVISCMELAIDAQKARYTRLLLIMPF